VPVTEISVDPATPSYVSEIVGIGQGKALADCELCFDQVEPGGFGVQTGRMWSRRSRARKRGCLWTLCRLSRTTKGRFRG